MMRRNSSRSVTFEAGGGSASGNGNNGGSSSSSSSSSGSSSSSRSISGVDDVSYDERLSVALSDATNGWDDDLEEASVSFGIPTTNSSNSQEGKNQSSVETRIWRCGRVAIAVAIMVTALAITFVTYRSLTDEQDDNFKTAFVQFSKTIADAAVSHQMNIRAALESLSNEVVAYSISTNSTHLWPTFTIPLFESYAIHFRRQSGSPSLSLHNVVPNDKRTSYTDWANANYEAAVAEGHRLAYDGLDRLQPVGYHPYIWRTTTTFENGEGPDINRDYYVANWAFSPPPSSYESINYNIASGPEETLMASLLKLRNESLVTLVQPYYDASAIHTSKNEKANTKSRTESIDSSEEGPHSFIFYPVHFDQIGALSKTTTEALKSPIVAVIGAAVYWEDSLQNLLPDGVNGIFAILRNNCQQELTFQIMGSKAHYRGEGDWHEKKYNSYKRVVALDLHTHPDFESVPGHCRYFLDIYPSSAFEDSYDTRTPERSAIITGLMFVVLATIFLVYDSLVERRHTKLVASAARTNAIVSSLFPGKIREQMLLSAANAESKRTDELENSDPDILHSIPRVYSTSNLKAFLKQGGTDAFGVGAAGGISHQHLLDSRTSKPLADFFINTTILFADISGFTAWSSVREPSQVFMLLESVYAKFDSIAKKRNIFKVETVGDCYVAVAGLPEPRSDHAEAMVRFARACLIAMKRIAKELEVSLGPDTGDLSMRMGIHSGSVTAGVLRGERARFQLFGDTVNTASRMESTGEVGRIQISQETATLLKEANKGHWIVPREQKVSAKGKGDIQTYWLRMGRVQNSSSRTKKCQQDEDEDVVDDEDDEIVEVIDDDEQENSDVSGDSDDKSEEVPEHKPSNSTFVLDEKNERLIDWSAELLLRLLKQVVARRKALMKRSSHTRQADIFDVTDDLLEKKGETFLDEVCEIITLPEFSSRAAGKEEDADDVEIPANVTNQLYDYVRCIANLYRDNPFHNFHHASHVAMSVAKLMSRIVAPSGVLEELDSQPFPDDMSNDGMSAEGRMVPERGLLTSDYIRKSFRKKKKMVAATLHDHTYGITSDPLTRFACAFSALIHDVDHTGVPNATLIQENSAVAAIYKNRSVAEQNSLEISWKLFMDDRYADLRRALISSVEELRRFRQLVVNSVMATDIVDKDLKALRNARWDKAFHKKKGLSSEDSGSDLRKSDSELSHDSGMQDNLERKQSRDDVNRKATIVIEHLIQASDVSHTMQHWHVYRKWNEKLFMELYRAYKAGRSSKNPAEFWYEGEIGFFDFYIIPLAKKLKECGVFGVSSDEYLDYAMHNRKEWQDRGQEVVAYMVEKLTKEPDDSHRFEMSTSSLHLGT